LCLPGSVLPKEKWFDKIWLDKWIHIGLFMVMVFSWSWFVAMRGGPRKSTFVQVAIYSLFYGIAMEFFQKYFVPNRSFDIADMLADGIGCVLGLYIWMGVIKK